MTHQTSAHDQAHTGLLQQILELDAVIHEALIIEAIEAAAQAAARTVTRIIDIGTGTGAGAFALAARFPEASVLAVDVDEDMLWQVRRRAEEQLVAGRITTVRADVAASDFDAGLADLIWSSNALHEVAAPVRAFENIFRSLRPGGILAVVEMDGPPLLLPQEHAPLETQLRRAAGADLGWPDWSESISRAGLDLVEMRRLTSEQLLPADGPGGTYAALELRRLAQHAQSALTEQASTDLRAIANDLAGHHKRLPAVHIRSTRTLWIARRP